jgi:hypothetical protein
MLRGACAVLLQASALQPCLIAANQQHNDRRCTDSVSDQTLAEHQMHSTSLDVPAAALRGT